ncbi:MAG: hypothetical protein ACE5FT_03365 [Candidatus Nanoarchaeia archaeon]
MKFSKALSKAWADCVRNPKYFVYAIVLDTVNFYVLWYFFADMLQKIIGHAEAVGTRFQGLPVPESIAASETIQSLARHQAFITEQYTMIMQLLVTLALGSYAMYAAFQGPSWWFAHKIADRKQTYKFFIPRFLVITLAGVLVYSTYMYGLGLIEQIGPVVVDTEIMQFVLVAGFIVCYYLLFMAYAAIGNKAFLKYFSNAVFYKFKKMVPAYLAIAFIAGVALWVFYQAIVLDPFFAVIISVLIPVPAHLFVKVYLIEMVKSLR